MKLEKFVIKYRLPIILLTFIVTIIVAIPLRNAKIDAGTKNFLPKNIPSRVNTEKIDEIFGASEPLMLLFESDDILNDSTLSRIKSICRKFDKMNELDKVMSLFHMKSIKGEYGTMIVDPAIKRIPKTEKQREKLRSELSANEMVMGVVVSENFRYTMVLATLKPEANEVEVLDKIDLLLAEYPGRATIHYGGTPYIRRFIEKDINTDFSILLPIALFIMLVFLYFSFREKRGVLLPFSVVLLSIIFSMGVLPLLGWPISIVTILVPIMLIAIANDYGIHFISYYQELNTAHPDWSMKQIVQQTVAHLKKPVTITALTTVAGILGLLAHIMVPARQVGVAAALGIVFALLLSLMYIPALLSYMKKGKPIHEHRNGKRSLLDRFLVKIGIIVCNYPKRVLIISFIIMLAIGSGILRLKVDSNTENLFPEKHPVSVCTEIINDELSGSSNILLMFEGDIKSPSILKKMDLIEKELINEPGIGDVFSLATVLRQMSKALNEPEDSSYNKIPDNRNAIAQYLELYLMNGDPEDLEQIVNFDFTQALLTIRINNANTDAIEKVLAKLNTLVENDSNIHEPAGYSIITYDLAHLIVKGQKMSLLFAIAAVVILLLIIFRSLLAGILGGVPLVLAIVILFGLMGWTGIPLDISSALLSSIMIGVGIDYTIHFLWRYKHERLLGLDSFGAVKKTLSTTGRGITINAFSVMIGFLVLFISAFASLKIFGFLIVFSILVCLLCALIVVPVLVLILNPKFLEK